ncbi:hypothetical protein FACS1894162_1270 [Bacteroidia bacterium]|nr:hypothetical protein FACS1894162_1270 [Bacteroidia bacterium]
MKKYILILLFTCSFASISAQNDFEQYRKQQQKEFSDYSTKQTKDFNNFRDKVNAEFADYVRQSWESFQAFQGIPIPKEPKPVTPPTVEPDPQRLPTTDPIPFKEIKPVPVAPFVKPQPIAPIPPSPRPTPAKPQFTFSYYGTDGKVSLDASHRFSLRDVSENSVADAWKTLSDSRYNDLLNDCLTLRLELNLCDWGYLEMLKTMSEKYFGKPCSEAVLMQMFILSQSGYKIRIARFGEQLALLVPFAQGMYEYSYVPVNGLKYYILDKSLKGKQFYMLNHEFPKEQQASLRMSQPNFDFAATPTKTFASKRYPSLSIKISTNKNLIGFYNKYPVSGEWNLYAQASLSKEVKEELYPALQKQIAGKREADAANILLNFVQTAFQYQTDQQQFGYERPLFADESFFYPYNDCEDRSILFATLVKDLLHLDVVLLHYPGHLATAVHFNENIQGDYLTVGGKKFIVCDPTYIAVPIGTAMPEYKNTVAEVVKI